ncbi:MAG: OmpH family outer membrane protein [Alphaproteobacteria bacterium]
MTSLKLLRQFALISLTAFSLFTVVDAAAQQSTPAAKSTTPVILIVDYQKVVRDAESAKSIRQQIDAYRQNFQKEISAKETDLAAKQQELSKQSTVMSAEALTAKRKEFEQQVSEVQRMTIIRSRMLDEAYGKAMSDFNSVLQSIVDRLADERSADLILPRAGLLFVAKNLDVTDEALKRLNQQLPKVTIQMPAPPPANAPATAAKPSAGASTPTAAGTKSSTGTAAPSSTTPAPAAGQQPTKP